ncbi:MAG: hypothetical protein ACLQHF_06235 [Terracidiphilus sp.]
MDSSFARAGRELEGAEAFRPLKRAQLHRGLQARAFFGLAEDRLRGIRLGNRPVPLFHWGLSYDLLTTNLNLREVAERLPMSIRYGLAEFDRFTGKFDWNINLPMDGVQPGFLYEFFKSAGESGWELCGTFPCGVPGSKRAIPGRAEPKVCEDPMEEVALIFKHVE